MLELTPRCNLRCPICFASADHAGNEPTLAEIESWLQRLQAHSSPVNIQLSGGEPSIRDDLPEIIRLTHCMGFDFVQLNTNGILLAKEPDYAKTLKEAGLDCVFLQFDGVSDRVYQHIRGARLLEIKIQAIEHCAQAHLGVVLVPTLIPNVNVDEIGAIIAFALAHVPTIRAVHFQPISYFGRYPKPPADHDRITLPEVMQELEIQTHGMVHAADFSPGSAENAYCSFSGKFFVDTRGHLSAPAKTTEKCCSTQSGCGCGAPIPGEDVQRARRVVAGQWAAEQVPKPTAVPSQINISSLDAFLALRRHSFSISGMVFQDAWNLDLERLRECFIHVVSPDRRIIPFCAYNLTAASGQALYRRPHHEHAQV
nr:radical SAM (seleno)protein TrsS [Uliginosibacterium gangwonense]